MPFRCSLPLLIVAALVMAFAPAVRCLGQGRPGPLPPSVTGSPGLTPEQTALAKAYADYWTGILKDPASKPEEIEEARTELIRPTTNIQVSLAFRFDYSKMVVPRFEEVLDGGNLHAIVNAMIVCSVIGGDRASNFVVDNADVSFQPKWQIRIQAAQGATNLLKGDSLDARKMLTAADRLSQAASREDNALVLRHLMLAIDAADHNPVPAANRAQLRAKLVETIVLVIDRVAKINAADQQPMLEAIAEAVSKVRNKFVDPSMTPTERTAIGKDMAPAMAKMLAMISADWDNAQADERKQRNYSVIVGGLEGFLPTIDASVRGGTPSQTTMRQAWDAANKATFEAELGKWTQVLQQPQYASGR